MDRLLLDDVQSYLNSDIKKALTNFVKIQPEMIKFRYQDRALNQQIINASFASLSLNEDFEIFRLLKQSFPESYVELIVKHRERLFKQ